MLANQKKKSVAMEYELCIMRHGIAASRGTASAMDDDKRPLTPEGREKMVKISAGLERLGLELDWIISSPLTRAMETAELVAGTLGTRVPLDKCDALRPGGTPQSLLEFLAVHPDRKKVLVVGHEPSLSLMVSWLIGAGSEACLEFKKGGCCLLHFDQSPQAATRIIGGTCVCPS